MIELRIYLIKKKNWDEKGNKNNNDNDNENDNAGQEKPAKARTSYYGLYISNISASEEAGEMLNRCNMQGAGTIQNARYTIRGVWFTRGIELLFIKYYKTNNFDDIHSAWRDNAKSTY